MKRQPESARRRSSPLQWKKKVGTFEGSDCNTVAISKTKAMRHGKLQRGGLKWEIVVSMIGDASLLPKKIGTAFLLL